MLSSVVTLHRRALFAGAGAALCLRDAATAAPKPLQRPFEIGDYLRREALIDTVFSPLGNQWAVLIQRSLTAGGFFTQSDTVVTPRCDVFLWQGDRLGKLTSGDDWALAPVFSPSGGRVAVPRIARSGQVRLEIYDVQTGAVIAASDLPGTLDLAIRLSRHGSRAACIQWRCERRLVGVMSADLYRPRAINGLDSADRASALARRAVEGELSVRRWRSEDTGTCGAGARLFEWDTDQTSIRILAEGDIRAVSMSPSGEHIALVRADGRPSIGPRQPMPAPLGETAGGYEDTRVDLRLDRIELGEGRRETTNFRGVGSQPLAFAPLWSDDGARLAVPHRTAYSSRPGDSAVWISEEGGAGTVWSAPSPLDAVIRAHAVVAFGRDAASRVLPMFGDASKPLGRSIGGRVERVGRKVLVLVGNRMSLLSADAQAERTIESVEPESLDLGGGNALFVSGVGRTRKRNVISPDRLVVSDEVEGSGPVEATFRHPARSGVIVFQDRADSTCLVELTSDRTRERIHHLLNTHMADVRVPHAENVTYAGAVGQTRRGVLYRPTNTEAPAKPPVIVYAYPQYAPDPNGRLGRPNSRSAWSIQSLLAQGFAVFHAAFPIENAGAYNAPFHRVAAEVLPALDVLDRRTDVQSGSYGFYGHSNGGYAGLALGAQTDRFKAIVAAAPFPDSFDTNLSVTAELRRLDCAPAVVQARRHYLEAPIVPYAYGADPVGSAELFIGDSPLYNLARYTTPTLMLYGENDVSLQAVEKMFLALQVAGVPVELDTYWGDSHVLSSPGNIRDATARQLGWFKRWL